MPGWGHLQSKLFLSTFNTRQIELRFFPPFWILFVLRQGGHLAQPGFEIALWLRMTLNSSPNHPHLPSARIRDARMADLAYAPMRVWDLRVRMRVTHPTT